MEWSWKKTLIMLGILVGIIVLPFFLVSNTMMDWYHNKIDAEPESDTSKWLALQSADMCYRTFRPERAVDYYRKYVELYPEDPDRKYAILRYALALEECSRRADAIKVYKKAIEEYPDDLDMTKEARTGITRCMYGPTTR